MYDAIYLEFLEKTKLGSEEAAQWSFGTSAVIREGQKMGKESERSVLKPGCGGDLLTVEMC